MQNIIPNAQKISKGNAISNQGRLGQTQDPHIKQTGLELEMDTRTKALVLSLELVHVVQGGVGDWEQVCVG